jgi:hypothetical protein
MVLTNVGTKAEHATDEVWIRTVEPGRGNAARLRGEAGSKSNVKDRDPTLGD